jgi:putative photosynthetic complex assembly protein
MTPMINATLHKKAARGNDMIPKPILRLMLALVVASLALTTYAVLTGAPLAGVPEASPVVAERQLVITTGGAQAVTVHDADGTLLEALDHGGFITVVGSAIDRERTVHRLPLDAPVTLARRENGRFSVIDPTTGWSVELTIFGADNEAAFARLLPAPDPASTGGN